MRLLLGAASGAAVLSLMLAAAPTFAQAPAQQAPAAPAPTPAAPQAAPAPEQRPFPDGAKYAFVNIARIAAESNEGKAATGKVQALNQQKVSELNERNKQLQGTQQKLQSGASVLSPNAAAQLQADIERMQVDIQRFTEDAQKEVGGLQQQLQADFEEKLTPILAKIGMERGLHFMFSVQDAGVVWGDPALDITTEIITQFNAANPGAPAPAQRPAATAPRPAAPAAPAPTVPPPAPRPN